MRGKKLLVTLLAMFLLAVTLGACGSGSGTPSGGADSGSGETIVLRAASETTFPPYTYLDESGTLTGYDVDVVRAISDRLDGYEIQIDGLGYEAGILALDSREADIFFDEMTITEERQEKYYFSEPYSWGHTVVIVKKGSDIKNFSDLEGRVVGNWIGDVQAAYLEKYNETAATPIKIEYITSGTEEEVFLDIQNGKYEAHLTDPVTAETIIAANGLDLEILAEEVPMELEIGLMFNKDEHGAELKALIDPIIKQLHEDGTLAALSIQHLGKDYIPK